LNIAIDHEIAFQIQYRLDRSSGNVSWQFLAICPETDLDIRIQTVSHEAGRLEPHSANTAETIRI
jgi:hypothetical protein